MTNKPQINESFAAKNINTKEGLTNKIKQNSKKRIEEAIWIEQSIAGDKEAFAKLFNRYKGQIKAFCNQMLREKNDIEDAVQQVFLEAWTSIHRFEGRSLFSTWLTKIAIHICLAFFRKQKRTLLQIDNNENILKDNDDSSLWCSKPKTPEDNVHINRQRIAFNNLVSNITKKKKIVFLLSNQEGLTAPEISKLLGIPDATVRTRLFHARKELGRHINKNPLYKDLFGKRMNTQGSSHKS